MRQIRTERVYPKPCQRPSASGYSSLESPGQPASNPIQFAAPCTVMYSIDFPSRSSLQGYGRGCSSYRVKLATSKPFLRGILAYWMSRSVLTQSDPAHLHFSSSPAGICSIFRSSRLPSPVRSLQFRTSPQPFPHQPPRKTSSTRYPRDRFNAITLKRVTLPIIVPSSKAPLTNLIFSILGTPRTFIAPNSLMRLHRSTAYSRQSYFLRGREARSRNCSQSHVPRLGFPRSLRED